MVGLNFATDFLWLFIFQVRPLDYLKKSVEKFTLLPMRPGRVEQVCDDVREAIFVWINPLEDVEIG